MKRTPAEQALGKLFDDVVRLMELAEKQAHESKAPLPEGIMEALEKLEADVAEMRRQDKWIRKQLAINEDSFQASIEGTVGLNPYRKRLIERSERLQKELSRRIHEAETELAVIETSAAGNLEKIETRAKKSKKRAETMRRLRRKKDWLQM